jgi:hypothetical protein
VSDYNGGRDAMPVAGVAALPVGRVAHLGWPHPMDRPLQPVQPMQPASRLVPVAAFTTSLLKGVHGQRKAAHLCYVRQALQQQGPGGLQQHRRALVATMGAVWRLPWDNGHKEVLWRLAVNGVPGARVPGPCACGARQPLGPPQPLHNRLHSFWECPVARAVVAQLALGAGVQQVPLRCLWLLQPPSPDVSLPVWQVAALAALGAMEHGRCSLWALYHRPSAVGWDAAGAVERVSREAAARFWFSLEDFAAGQEELPAAWPAAGPFFVVQDGRLAARGPPAAP